ncbi:MAG: DUF6588 family protein [Bacteroidia bacterium]|jgi:hypothetical protein
MKKSFLLVCALSLLQFSYAQTNVAEFLKAGQADANALVKAYLNPYAMALGDGLNNGWYNSAATHRLFGFDLSISASAIQIPGEAKTFDISKIGLTNISVVSGGNLAPTIAGADAPGPLMQIKDAKGKNIGTFNSPNGFGVDIVPVPMAQIGFGLIPNTDIIGRYVPDLSYNYGTNKMKLGSWGIGVKHNFMKWVPFLKSLPFDASVFGSYSEVNAQNALSFTPENYNLNNVVVTFTSDNSQLMKVKSKTSKFGLIVSKKLGVITFFGGIGQSTSESGVNLVGKYPVITTAQGGGQVITNEAALIDPISIQFTSKNICMDAGLKLKLLFFSIFGTVNKAEYTSFNAGISFGTR